MPSTSETARSAVYGIFAAFVALGVIDGLVAALRLGILRVGGAAPAQVLALGLGALGVAAAATKVALLVWVALGRAPTGRPRPLPFVGLLVLSIAGWIASVAFPAMNSTLIGSWPSDQVVTYFQWSSAAAMLESGLVRTGFLVAMAIAFVRARSSGP